MSNLILTDVTWNDSKLLYMHLTNDILVSICLIEQIQPKIFIWESHKIRLAIVLDLAQNDNLAGTSPKLTK